MPIKGFAERQQMVRAGHLRIGAKETKRRDNGSEYEVPVKLDHFLFDPHDLTLMPAFKALYGEQPKSLPVWLHADDLEEVFPYYFQAYRSNKLWCKGDNETAQRKDFRTDPPTISTVDCNEQCPFRKSRDPEVNKADKNRLCAPVGTLRVILPELPSLGLFEIKASEMSINRLLAALTGIQVAFQGRLRMIDLNLSVVPTTITKKGSAITVYVLDLTPRMDTSFKELLARQSQTLLGPGVATPALRSGRRVQRIEGDEEPELEMDALVADDDEPAPEVEIEMEEEGPVAAGEPEPEIEDAAPHLTQQQKTDALFPVPANEPASHPAAPPAETPAPDLGQDLEGVRASCFALIERLPETQRTQPTMSMKMFTDPKDVQQLKNFHAFLTKKVEKNTAP